VESRQGSGVHIDSWPIGTEGSSPRGVKLTSAEVKKTFVCTRRRVLNEFGTGTALHFVIDCFRNICEASSSLDNDVDPCLTTGNFLGPICN
jgi:hypothetical protein